MLSNSTVLVVGATGNQGGAVVDRLLAADEPVTVRGLTRHPESERASALAERGVEVIHGDLDDESTLAGPLEGVDAAFVVTNFWTAGFDGQVRQGETIADALAEAGVDHVVFSGAGYHERDIDLGFLQAAGAIERYMRSLELPVTVLKPVWFMHNLEPMVEDILDGTLALPLAEGVDFQMVDVVDIARVTVEALRRPDEFVGESFDIAGDEHTLSEMAAIIANVSGHPVEPFHVPIDAAREELGDEMATLFEWFNEEGYDVDILGLEDRLGIELTRFEEYLVSNGWEEKSGPTRIPGYAKAMMDE